MYHICSKMLHLLCVDINLPLRKQVTTGLRTSPNSSRTLSTSMWTNLGTTWKPLEKLTTSEVMRQQQGLKSRPDFFISFGMDYGPLMSPKNGPIDHDFVWFWKPTGEPYHDWWWHPTTSHDTRKVQFPVMALVLKSVSILKSTITSKILRLHCMFWSLVQINQATGHIRTPKTISSGSRCWAGYQCFSFYHRWHSLANKVAFFMLFHGLQEGVSWVVDRCVGQPAAHFRNIFQEVGFSAAALQNLDQEQRDVAEALVRAAGCVHALWSSAGAGKTTFWPCVSWNGRTNPTLQPWASLSQAESVTELVPCTPWGV